MPNIVCLRVRVAAIVLPLLLSACTTVPGMYVGVKNTSKVDGDSASDTDVASRADIHTISAESVAKMATERQAEATIQKARQASALLEVEAPYRYLVSAQDILRITIWNHPELTNPGGTYNELSGRVVNDQGNFFYPYIGVVRAAGRTVDDIRQEMAQRLTTYLREPQVEVAVQTYRGQRAFVVGEVTKPGVLQITDVPLRITDLITLSEGLTKEADLSAATLTRQGVTRKVDLYALYYQGDVSQNLALQNGDIVNIPERRFNKVFVLGEVIKPASLPMPRGRLTLAEALSDAGGVDPTTSNARQIYVIRGAENGRPQIWHLNAASPDALILADRFDLNARDIVYVDAAAVTRFSRVINQIIPTAALLREGVSDYRTNY